jgi:hypothetical protein
MTTLPCGLRVLCSGRPSLSSPLPPSSTRFPSKGVVPSPTSLFNSRLRPFHFALTRNLLLDLCARPPNCEPAVNACALSEPTTAHLKHPNTQTLNTHHIRTSSWPTGIRTGTTPPARVTPKATANLIIRPTRRSTIHMRTTSPQRLKLKRRTVMTIITVLTSVPPMAPTRMQIHPTWTIRSCRRRRRPMVPTATATTRRCRVATNGRLRTRRLEDSYRRLYELTRVRRR